MKKYTVILDLIFYMALPFAIWTYGRESLGDYWAMLLSTAPGFIYTIINFVRDRQFNITGIFILVSLLVGTVVDILSGTAERMLWNQVFVGVAFSGVFLISMLIKKPLPLYFMMDMAFLQGYPRESSRMIYFKKELLRWFQLLTLIFVLRGITLALLKSWLLNKHGVDAYGSMLIYLRVTSWIFGGVMIIGYIFIGNEIKKVVSKLTIPKKEIELVTESK